MTQNQIAFFKAKEEQRHNIVAETETGRHNREDEAIRYEGNQINREANTINQMHFERMDQINREHYERSDYEQRRHNLETENVAFANLAVAKGELAEQTRHNRRTEKQTTRSLNQSKKERQERVRHNKQEEAIGWANVNAAYIQASASQAQAAAAGRTAEANYMNAVTHDYDVRKSHTEKAYDQSLQAADVGTRKQQADEQHRHNFYTEESGAVKQEQRWWDIFWPFP